MYSMMRKLEFVSLSCKDCVEPGDEDFGAALLGNEEPVVGLC